MDNITNEWGFDEEGTKESKKQHAANGNNNFQQANDKIESVQQPLKHKHHEHTSIRPGVDEDLGETTSTLTVNEVQQGADRSQQCSKGQLAMFFYNKMRTNREIQERLDNVSPWCWPLNECQHDGRQCEAGPAQVTEHGAVRQDACLVAVRLEEIDAMLRMTSQQPLAIVLLDRRPDFLKATPVAEPGRTTETTLHAWDLQREREKLRISHKGDDTFCVQQKKAWNRRNQGGLRTDHARRNEAINHKNFINTRK